MRLCCVREDLSEKDEAEDAIVPSLHRLPKLSLSLSLPAPVNREPYGISASKYTLLWRPGPLGQDLGLPRLVCHRPFTVYRNGGCSVAFLGQYRIYCTTYCALARSVISILHV